VTHHAADPKTITLADGRIMAYEECGDPDGLPLIHGHGGLACRLDAQWASDVARERNIRLISPDRPGIARSDPKPGHVTGDWTEDVEQLADHLGIERFLTNGWSLGGQYVLGLATKLPDRVIATGIIDRRPTAGRPEAPRRTHTGHLQ